MKILRQVEIIILMPIFFAEFILSFAQYEMKSSDATPFRGSILMRCRLLESFFYMLLSLLSKLLRHEDFVTG